MSIEEGDKIPPFDLPTDGGGRLKAAGLKGKKAVIYFYPKDMTSGCTREAQDFAAAHGDFTKAGTAILGVSRDSVKRHDNFIAKHALPFRLISDENGTLCEAFGVWVEKNMYGRKYFGIERATFLIDAKGKVATAWRKVKVKDHVAAVLEAARSL